MATQHLDLEEQEQLDQIKQFWKQYGNLITWLLIAVLGAYAAWNAWQYWQRQQSAKAAGLYEQLERVVQSGDTARVQQVLDDLRKGAGSTLLAQHGALLAARAFGEAGQTDAARSALQSVLDESGDDGLLAVARLRLAALDLEANDPAAALTRLQETPPEPFVGLYADRRGDALMLQGKADEARAAYQQAFDAMPTQLEYRRMVEAKLNALGVRLDAPAVTDAR